MAEIGSDIFIITQHEQDTNTITVAQPEGDMDITFIAQTDQDIDTPMVSTPKQDSHISPTGLLRHEGDINDISSHGDDTYTEQENIISVRNQKGKTQPQNWLKNKQKTHRNSGEAYISAKNKYVSAKDMNTLPTCNGKQNHVAEVSMSDIMNVHTHYWELEDNEHQTDLIKHLIFEKPVVQTKGKRHFMRQFTLPTDSGEQVTVCNNFFLSSLLISEKRMQVVLDKVRDSPMGFIKDKRGQHVPGNKTIDEKHDEVVQHISSFPVMASHYCRKSSNKLYLASDLNVSITYILYCDFIQTQSQ